MQFFKRRLAVLLTILLIMPTFPARAEETELMTDNSSEMQSEYAVEGIGDMGNTDGLDGAHFGNSVSGNDAEVNSPLTEPPRDSDPEIGAGGAAEAGRQPDAGENQNVDDTVFFNTGNHAWKISAAAVSGNDAADGYFEEDGSFTINIPEENPFFPYEVQFTYRGEVTERWFMTPDDSVEVGGHTFYVSACFDNTVVTQMSLNVAGDTVVVYPEKKEFTTGGDGAETISLLPLEERSLRADLTAYTPAELTMVSVDSLFAGENALKDMDKVVWTAWSYESDGDFTISEQGEKLDLSYGTGNGWMAWQMIVGEVDQLNADNIRYRVSLELMKSENWLIPSVYVQDEDGKCRELSVVNVDYGDYYGGGRDGRQLSFGVSSGEASDIREFYVGLEVNPDILGGAGFDHFKVYDGKYYTAEEAVKGEDITAQLFGGDMAQPDGGCAMENYAYKWITMISYDADGNVTGCLPFALDLSITKNYVSFSLFQRTENGRNYVDSGSRIKYLEDYTEKTVLLYKGYAANAPYCLTMSYYKDNVRNMAAITAVYKGLYNSMADAAAAGAENVKDALCGGDYDTQGYVADYSQDVYFTAFIGEDGTEGQEVYRYCIRTEEGTEPAAYLGSGTSVRFYNLRKSDGTLAECYVVGYDEDSYAEYNYLTILVGPDTDLTSLAPCFSTSNGVKLYAAGSSSPEISGESMHDFSQGPMQYTAAAENGTDAKNYWLQIVKAVDGKGWLYVNSLADPDAHTGVENGAVVSTREVMLDGYHEYIHDIWMANMGTDAIADLSAELESSVVELDEYWTLKGKHDLSGFSVLNKTESNGELPNLAKIRLRAKEGAGNGESVSGTLTIKSGNTPLAILTLTGTVGDPCITTKEIPEAVKYVPYGTVIQNNNKYSWNKVSYRLVSGKNSLPKGMTVKQNGEIYGVPAETGEFTFTVEMKNGNSSFSSSRMTYTLIVAENTNENVDNATDAGYELSERVQDVRQDVSGNQTLVSQGEYAEFVAIYLDGEKLVAGDDYTAESGSTRITILNQTLVRGGVGTHTLGIEFRTKDTDVLKRSAQNYNIGGDGGADVDNAGDDNTDGDHEDDDNDGDEGGAGNGDNAGPSDEGNAGGVENANYDSANVSNAGGAAYAIYMVLPGDSLWKIAARFYGTGDLWRKIYEDNAAVIKNPGRIYTGQILRIYLTEKNESGASNAEAGSTAGDNAGSKVYRVMPGDSLWTIARRMYGNGGLWGRIYQANRNIMADPRRLYRGQMLVIPEM